MKVVYNIGIVIFTVLAHIISPFSPKARLWINGRKKWYRSLEQKISDSYRYVWVHCASLGEFEQGRPVIEAIKSTMPEYRIVLTFFSPSGYEVRKNYADADVVCYLPADTPCNAKKFVSVINPAMALFIKYEFWNNYISVIHKRGIPLYLVSGIFRPSQVFFRWYGSFFRKMLMMFSHIFVQDPRSEKLLKNIGVKDVTVAGDTRFDRVVQISGAAKEIQQLELFRGGEKLFLAGSSWHQDEEIFARYINSYPDRMKWVFAPHETNAANVDRLEKLFSVDVVRFSRFTENSAKARVLILDNMGMLSSAYRYAYIAAVGGGFGKGIHNVLEPACWGIPVIFGPEYKKFREAVELIKKNGARTFKTFEEFAGILESWLSDDIFYLKSADSAGTFVKENTGATTEIMSRIAQEGINNYCL